MGAELQLLRLIECNLPNKGIASYLGVSESEVSSRMTRLHQTLGLTRPDDSPRLAAPPTPTLPTQEIPRR